MDIYSLLLINWLTKYLLNLYILYWLAAGLALPGNGQNPFI